MRAPQMVGADVGLCRGCLPALAFTLTFTLAFLMPLNARGQSVDLTGTVVDSLTNEVLPNVSVALGESSYSALTDAFGRFSLVGLPDGPIQLHHRASRLPDVRARACRGTDGPAEGDAGTGRHRTGWNPRASTDTGHGRQPRDQPGLDLSGADPGSAVFGRGRHLPLAPTPTGRERYERRHLGTLRAGWDA